MAKRKVKKSIKLFSTLIVLLLVGLLSYKFIYPKFINSSDTNKPIKIKDILKKEDPIKVYKASLIATGDGLLHSPIYNAAKKSDGTYDFTRMLSYTKDKIKNYDIKYYNQETVMDDSINYSSYPVFNSPSQFGTDMVNIGFNMVSLATNHSMDRGGTAAKNTAKFWKSKKNVLTNGLASSEEDRTNYQIKEANGITYTMLSYTYGTNGMGTSELSREPYIVNVYNEELVKKDIEAVRDKVDILIVAMHWGNEYQLTATETQKSQAKFLADNGVDIILGTHSHCIQPWEMIDDTVVFYSFGNFISNQMGAEQAMVRKVGVVGMFATLDITKTVDTEKNTTDIKIDNIGADLNYTYRFYNNEIKKNDYLVIPFSKMESKYLSNYESVYNEFSQVLKKYNENINIEPLPSAN